MDGIARYVTARNCCESEIKYLHNAFGCDYDIARLQIAMDIALFVRCFESIGYLPRGQIVTSVRDLGRTHRAARGLGATCPVSP